MEEVCPGASIDGYTSTASAVWSPNGQQIAFEVNCCRENTDIAVVNSDGSNIRYLTNLQSVESSGERPKWSPDGQRILFTQGGEGNREIFIINADGSNLINLSNHPNDDYDPSWSPNGNQIVFTSNRDGSYQIYQINVDGSNLNRLTEVDSDNYSPRLIPSYTPSWSPNGTQIAFVHYGEIYVVSIDGTGLSRVTNLDELGFERIGIGGVRWLPNGQGLIFVLSYQSSSTDPGSRDIRWVNIACLNEPEGCTADDTLIVLNSQSVLDFDIYPNSNNPQQIIP
jgi:TolB protein